MPYGFETVGPNVWVTDVASKGSVLITVAPEPSTAAMFAAGVLGMMASRRRKTR